MIEVLKNIIDLMILFITKAFEFKIDINNQEVSVFTLAIAFTAIVIIIYLVMRGLGFISKGDD